MTQSALRVYRPLSYVQHVSVAHAERHAGARPASSHSDRGAGSQAAAPLSMHSTHQLAREDRHVGDGGCVGGFPSTEQSGVTSERSPPRSR